MGAQAISWGVVKISPSWGVDIYPLAYTAVSPTLLYYSCPSLYVSVSLT